MWSELFNRFRHNYSTMEWMLKAYFTTVYTNLMITFFFTGMLKLLAISRWDHQEIPNPITLIFQINVLFLLFVFPQHPSSQVRTLIIYSDRMKHHFSRLDAKRSKRNTRPNIVAVVMYLCPSYTFRVHHSYLRHVLIHFSSTNKTGSWLFSTCARWLHTYIHTFKCRAIYTTLKRFFRAPEATIRS